MLVSRKFRQQRTRRRIVVDREDADGSALDLGRERVAREPREERLAVDRLDEVVDRAEGQPHLALVDDRHDDDRHVAQTRVDLELAQDVPAVEIRQQDIEQDRARDSLDGRPQARRAVGHVRVLKSARTPTAAAGNLVPQGGLFWDGRADTLQQQASGPMFNPAEMDAGSVAVVAKKLEESKYAGALRRLFGAGLFGNPRQAVAEAMFAVARFEIEDPSFHPFTSKYDAWLEGKARFTPAEARGYLAFNDPRKGNCAACHLDRPTPDGLPPLFTDDQYEALGVPRNPDIPANKDSGYHDLGICGPFRTDMRDQHQYCGMFLTPTLRNVALRKVFFHNGVFHSLNRVLDWYVNRDLHPARFYPRGKNGEVIKYDDLPAQFRGNVDTRDAPFDRHPGDRPALSRAEIRDVVAFLRTLTDGNGQGQRR